MPGGVDGQRGHELGEAVEEEARAVAQRGERGQVLVRPLEPVGVEHALPVGRAAARGAEREPQGEREAERGGGERGRRERGGEQPRRRPHRERRAAPPPRAPTRVAAGSQRPTNGGNGSPSSRPSWRSQPQPGGHGERHDARTPRPGAGAAARSRTPARVAQRRHRAVMPPCHARRMVPRAALVLLLALLAGCGSAPRDELPPAAEPASSPPTGRGARRPRRAGRRSSPRASSPTRRPGWSPSGCAARTSSRSSTARPARCASASRCPPRRAISRSSGPAARCWCPPRTRTRCCRSPCPAARCAARRRGREPHDAAAAGGRVFVADEFANTLTVLEDGRPVTRIAHRAPARRRDAARRGPQVAVVSVRERVVEVFDAASGERTGRAPGRRRADARRLGRRQLPVRHRHRRRRAARLPPAPGSWS